MGNHIPALSAEHVAFLEKTFARNRNRFGGWFMEDPAPSDPTPADPPPSDPAPTDPPKSDPDKKPPWGDHENFNAEKAWELIQSLRASDRPGKVTELQDKVKALETAHQAQMDALAKALGLKQDDTPPDPTKLAEQIAASQAETGAEKDRADAAERALAVFKRALDPQAGLNANPLALLDSNTFLSSIRDLDHADTEKLDEAIKAALDANPLLKAANPTPPFPGGPRPPAPTGAGSLGEAIAKKLASQHR